MDRSGWGDGASVLKIDGLRVGRGVPALVIADLSAHASDPRGVGDLVRAAPLAGADAVRVRVPPGSPISERATLAGWVRTAREAHAIVVATCTSPRAVEDAIALRIPLIALDAAGLADRSVLDAAAESRLPTLISCARISAAILVRAIVTLETRAIPMFGGSTAICGSSERDPDGAASRLPWGHSAHEPATEHARAALTRGAAVIERALCADRRSCDRRRRRCADAALFHALVTAVREAEAIPAAERRSIGFKSDSPGARDTDTPARVRSPRR